MYSSLLNMHLDFVEEGIQKYIYSKIIFDKTTHYLPNCWLFFRLNSNWDFFKKLLISSKLKFQLAFKILKLSSIV